MQRRQNGQIFLFVLIILAIGALIIIPVLQLTQSSLKNSPVITSRLLDFYAADAAQEYVLWKLQYTDYVTQFTADGQSDSFSIDICGKSVDVEVVMRALASFKGVTLIGDTPVKPSVTVDPDTDPYVATYTIKLEKISGNTTEHLDSIYDILPADFDWDDYIPGSSLMSIDGGSWQDIVGDPSYESFGGVQRLRWPASGDFGSTVGDFIGGQTKELKFQMYANQLKNNVTYYDWVVLKPWNTLSGPQAPITTGTGAGAQGGLIDISIEVTPDFIPPGIATNVTYAVSITNQQRSTDQLQVLENYLPPGFEYVGPTTGMTSSDPVVTLTEVNGVERNKLVWTKNEFPGGNDISIASGGTVHMTFVASSSENVSGSYYNELLVSMKNPIPSAFSDLGLTYNDFNSGYTWNSAPVVVPAYDTETTSGNVTVDSNLAITSNGVAITSFNVK